MFMRHIGLSSRGNYRHNYNLKAFASREIDIALGVILKAVEEKMTKG